MLTRGLESFELKRGMIFTPIRSGSYWTEKNVDSGVDVEYVATFEIYPTVALNDVKDFAVTKLTCDISDDDVDEIIHVFQKQQGQLVDVDRAAEDGDTLTIDFEGTKDGEIFEGGSGTDTSLELGSGRMIPGFEDGLVGASVVAGEAYYERPKSQAD